MCVRKLAHIYIQEVNLPPRSLASVQQTDLLYNFTVLSPLHLSLRLQPTLQVCRNDRRELAIDQTSTFLSGELTDGYRTPPSASGTLPRRFAWVNRQNNVEPKSSASHCPRVFRGLLSTALSFGIAQSRQRIGPSCWAHRHPCSICGSWLKGQCFPIYYMLAGFRI
jgi:hypothetical protein